MDIIFNAAASFLSTLLGSAPWILLSFFLAAILREATSFRWTRERLGKKGFLPPVYASLAGLATPA